MPTTLEERVAYLEGKVEEHSYAWQDLRERITHMEQKFDQRFMQMDQRFAQIDQRIDKLFLFILTTMISSIGALIGVIVSIFTK